MQKFSESVDFLIFKFKLCNPMPTDWCNQLPSFVNFYINIQSFVVHSWGCSWSVEDFSLPFTMVLVCVNSFCMDFNCCGSISLFCNRSFWCSKIAFPFECEFGEISPSAKPVVGDLGASAKWANEIINGIYGSLTKTMFILTSPTFLLDLQQLIHERVYYKHHYMPLAYLRKISSSLCVW